MNLAGCQLESLDVTGMYRLKSIDLTNNPLTTSSNDQLLQQLSQYGTQYNNQWGGLQFNNGWDTLINANYRTSSSNTDYDNLDNTLNWTINGLNLV